MSDDILFILIFSLIFLLITIAVMYSIIFIFIGDWKYSYMIFNHSLKLSVLKKSYQEKQDDIIYLLNNYAKELIKDNMKLTDKELAMKMNISIAEAKTIKNDLTNKINKQKETDMAFISNLYINKISKRFQSFDFINLITSFIISFSDLESERYLLK